MIGPDYEKLDAGTYSIPFGEVAYKPIGYKGGFKTFGDVDSFMLELTPTMVDRWSKNGAVQEIAASVVTRLESSVSFKPMQFTDYSEAISFSGTPYSYTQEAGEYEVLIDSLVAGDHYHAGAQDITEAAFEYAAQGGTMKAVPANLVKIVDAQLGFVRLLGLPADALAANGVIAGALTVTATAITAADKRTRVDIGSSPRVSLEIVVRNLSNVGTHSAVWLRQVDLGQDGGRGLISANGEFEGIGLKGKAVRVNGGLGFFQRLKKAA